MADQFKAPDYASPFPPNQDPVTPEYLKNRQDAEGLEYTRTQAAKAAYDLATTEGTTSALRSLFQKSTDEKTPELSVEELDKLYPHLKGSFKTPMPTALAARQVGVEEDRRRLESIMSNSPGDFLDKAGQFAGGLIGGVDATDIAISSLMAESPLIGKIISPAHKRMQFFVSNLIENSISEIPININAQDGLRQYNLDSSIRNIGMGALGGQAIYEGARGLGKIFSKVDAVRKQKLAVANEVANLKPETNFDIHQKDMDSYKNKAYEFRPLESTLADRPFYFVDNNVDSMGERFVNSDAPFSEILGGRGVLITDNADNAISNNLSESTDGNQTFKKIEFHQDNEHNLLDGNKLMGVDALVEMISQEAEALAVLQRHLGEEYTSGLGGEQTLKDIFERIDDDLANGMIDNEVEFRQNLKDALGELSRSGVDGIKLDYSKDPNVNSNAVLLFDHSSLKGHDVSGEVFKRENGKLDLKDNLEAMKDFRNDASHDPEVFQQFKELPSKYAEKLHSEVKAEVDNKIKETEIAHKSGLISKKEMDDILLSRASIEDELTAVKMAEFCSTGDF